MASPPTAWWRAVQKSPRHCGACRGANPRWLGEVRSGLGLQVAVDAGQRARGREGRVLRREHRCALLRVLSGVGGRALLVRLVGEGPH